MACAAWLSFTVIECSETALLHCFIILLLSAAVDPCANTEVLPVQSRDTLRLKTAETGRSGTEWREGLGDTDIVVLVQQKNLIVFRVDGISDMVGGVQQCWIMFGIGRRWERLSLTSSPCLLQCWRTKVFEGVSPFPLSGWSWIWVNTAEFFQITTTVCWSKV